MTKNQPPKDTPKRKNSWSEMRQGGRAVAARNDTQPEDPIKYDLCASGFFSVTYSPAKKKSKSA